MASFLSSRVTNSSPPGSSSRGELVGSAGLHAWQGAQQTEVSVTINITRQSRGVEKRALSADEEKRGTRRVKAVYKLTSVARMF